MQAVVASAEEERVREARGAREKGEMHEAVCPGGGERSAAEEEGARESSPAGAAPGAGAGYGAREKAEAEEGARAALGARESEALGAREKAEVEATLAGWQDSMALRRSHMQAIIYKLAYDL